jgi:hypothetical protein
MSATRTNHSTHTAREDSGSVLTAVRGMVRRLPECVEKQQLSLTAIQFEELSTAEGDNRDRLLESRRRHAALMAGQPLPVISCIEEHAPRVWALLQEARRQHAAG